MAPPHESATIHETNNTHLARRIGGLLRFGVIASLSLVALGTLITFVQHPEYVRAPEALQQIIDGGPSEPSDTASGPWAWLAASGSRAVVLAGLLVLIATPVLRVIVSMLVFVRQRDWAYVLLTLAVVVLLTVSFLMGMLK